MCASCEPCVYTHVVAGKAGFGGKLFWWARHWLSPVPLVRAPSRQRLSGPRPWQLGYGLVCPHMDLAIRHCSPGPRKSKRLKDPWGPVVTRPPCRQRSSIGGAGARGLPTGLSNVAGGALAQQWWAVREEMSSARIHWPPMTTLKAQRHANGEAIPLVGHIKQLPPSAPLP